MINRGSKIKLRPNMIYKDNPEKNELVGTGENAYGKYQQMQCLDLNNGADGKNHTGFIYIRVHSEIPLVPDDEIVVSEILYVQRKRNVVVVGVTILETNPFSVPEPEIAEDGTYDF